VFYALGAIRPVQFSTPNQFAPTLKKNDEPLILTVVNSKAGSV
jgi:hypothetical protein